MMTPLLSMKVAQERDLVAVRQRTRQVSAALGFESQEQTRIATAVSEICRNAYRYAGGGIVEFAVDDDAQRQSLVISVRDSGKGIADLQAILHGRYQSATGMGLGIQGARRLMDQFRIETAPGRGTLVTMRKALSRRAPGLRESDLTLIARQLASSAAANPFDELEAQNREFIRLLDELRRRQDDLAQLNEELENTNRGVVALYAELDEKAEDLKRANQLKSTFLSHMSHEFRTPLNSIMALSGILLERLDGPLTAEQEKQAKFIQKGAQELTDMVNDLLDLAKVEAGKIEIHPSEWQLSTLFGTLKGMLRPLLFQQPVHLSFVFDEDLTLYTDEGKVSQVLRNFVSNAIKFTEAGEIRVSAESCGGALVRFSVADPGIGIAPEDQERIFQQFSQVDNPNQRRVKGTGLGLSLSKKFAELLGGRIELVSNIGEGSTFSLIVPRRYGQELTAEATSREDAAVADIAEPSAAQPGVRTVLVIDDDDVARYLIAKQLADLPIQIINAPDATQGLQQARRERPNAIVLDLMMPEVSGFETLDELRSDTRTRDIPVIIHTSMNVPARERDILLAKAVTIVNKNSGTPGELRSALEGVLSPAGKVGLHMGTGTEQ